jgi:hypothetical protein
MTKADQCPASEERSRILCILLHGRQEHSVFHAWIRVNNCSQANSPELDRHNDTVRSTRVHMNGNFSTAISPPQMPHIMGATLRHIHMVVSTVIHLIIGQISNYRPGIRFLHPSATNATHLLAQRCGTYSDVVSAGRHPSVISAGHQTHQCNIWTTFITATSHGRNVATTSTVAWPRCIGRVPDAPIEYLDDYGRWSTRLIIRRPRERRNRHR